MADTLKQLLEKDDESYIWHRAQQLQTQGKGKQESVDIAVREFNARHGPSPVGVHSHKSINSGTSIVLGMPKAVRKDPEPEPMVEEEKSDTTIEPFADEEKDQEQPKGPVGDEMKAVPEDEDEDEDEEFEEALKAISGRFDRLEKTINALGDKFVAALEKSNYTSKPASLQGDYPTPPEAGPKSDGLQAPKIDQEMNPASKPFGKGRPIAEKASKVALGGAGDGSRERPVDSVESLREMRAAILKGETTIAKENAKRAAYKYGGQ